MKKTICDICGGEIKDEHLLVPKYLWWVAPSIKYVGRYEVCRRCWNELREQIRERRTNDHI
jgi:hypothetical protein